MRSRIEPYETQDLIEAHSLFTQAKEIRENISSFLTAVKAKYSNGRSDDKNLRDLQKAKLQFEKYKLDSQTAKIDLETENQELRGKLVERENYLERMSKIADELIPKISKNDQKIMETEQELSLKQARINKYEMERANTDRVYIEQIKILNERIELNGLDLRKKDKTLDGLRLALEDRDETNDLEREELKAVIEDLTRKLKHYEKTSN